jgi:transposase-like protein
MTNKTTNKFSAEVRERAVRMVREHEGDYASRWAAMASIAAKIGCTAETLRLWVRRAERESGGGVEGASGDVSERLKALERENRVQTPISSRHPFRFDAATHSDLIAPPVPG